MVENKLKATVRREAKENWYYIDKIEKPGIISGFFSDEPTKIYIKELTPKQLEEMNKILDPQEKKKFLRSIMPTILKFQNPPDNIKEGQVLPKEVYKRLQQNYTELEPKKETGEIKKLATV